MQTSSGAIRQLRAAADYIERNGLHKGNYFDIDLGGPELNGYLTEYAPLLTERINAGNPPACCILGSLYVGSEDWSSGHWSYDSLAVKALEHVIGDTHSYWTLHEWNDDPDRTAEDVISALRDAANWIAGKVKAPE